jgi:hypothetical protein
MGFSLSDLNPLPYLSDIGGKISGELNESPQDRFDQASQNNPFGQIGSPGAFGNQEQFNQNSNTNNGLMGMFLDQQGPESQFTAGAGTLLGQLGQTAAGNGPGQEMASNMANQQAERSNALQMGAANSARGAQGALAARGAAQNMANIGTGAAQAATQGGLQAQLGAQQQMSGLLQGLRGQDLRTGIQAQQLRQTGALGAQEMNMSNSKLQQDAMIERERQRTQRANQYSQGAAGLSGPGNFTQGAVQGGLELGGSVLKGKYGK